MNWADERAAFERRVSAGFTSLPVVYPGVPVKAPAADGYVKMSLLPSTAKRITLGDSGGIFREFGVLLFMICMPANSGSNPARVIADQLTALFHEAVFEYGQSGKIRCRVPVLDDRGVDDSGTWYQLNLVIDYERDVVLA